jgi:hypothetical protein
MRQRHRYARSGYLTPLSRLIQVKVQTSPAVILVPSGVEELFLKALQPSSAESYTISIRPQSEFNFENAKSKVLNLAPVLAHTNRVSLEIPDTVFGGEGERLVRMGGVIEWQKRNSVAIFLVRAKTVGRVCGSTYYVFEST